MGGGGWLCVCDRGLGECERRGGDVIRVCGGREEGGLCVCDRGLGECERREGRGSDLSVCVEGGAACGGRGGGCGLCVCVLGGGGGMSVCAFL